MRHVRLGRTGLPVSRLCLGTMTFGLQCDEATSVAILDRAAAGGITFLDTSDVYPIGGNLDTVGRTEEIIGRWLAGRRHDFVVATKCFAPMGRRPWQMGNSRRHIMDSIDASLRRLQTDFIDLYQQGNAAIERIARLRDGAVADVGAVMSRLTLEVLEQTLFSQGLGREPSAFQRAVTSYFETIGRIDPLDLLNAPAFLPRLRRRRGRGALEFFDSAVDAIIDNRKALLGRGAEAPADLKPGGYLLIESGSPQEGPARERIERYGGYELAKTVHDGSGHPRVLIARGRVYVSRET